MCHVTFYFICLRKDGDIQWVSDGPFVDRDVAQKALDAKNEEDPPGTSCSWVLAETEKVLDLVEV